MADTASKSNTGTKSTNDLGNDMEAVKSDLQSLRDDLKSLADNVVDEGKQRARSAGERVQSDVQQQTETVRQSITERPFTSVAVAGVIGVLLGLILHRR